MFYFTISLILALFVLDISLSILDYRQRNQPIPSNVSDVYNQEEYKKWFEYTMETFRLSIFTKILDTIVLIIFLVFNIFPMLAQFTERFSSNKIVGTILFLGVYALINYIINLGFSIYEIFNIEERYGFNQTTVKTFVTDQIKGILLASGLGAIVLYLLLYLYQRLGNSAFIYSWLMIMTFIIVINVLYSKVFIRLFNKLEPLEAGELYEKSKQTAESMGYEIKKISVMDASRRSTRLNAFFTGFGKFKSIILFDTLLEKCSTDEIISVLAHEIGHSKYRDVLKSFLTSAVEIAIYLGILLFFLSSSSFGAAFGFDDSHYGFAIILFGILMQPLGILLNIPVSALSRKAEYRADACAVEAGYKEAMISALKVLARENFSNLTPHPIVVKMTYSHPTISQRINAINRL